MNSLTPQIHSYYAYSHLLMEFEDIGGAANELPPHIGYMYESDMIYTYIYISSHDCQIFEISWEFLSHVWIG